MVTGMQGSRARSALEGSRFADVRWVTETESTNDDVLALARSGAPDGIVIVADHQRAGRGRLDRTWEAPPGSSLLLSVLVRPALSPADAHLVSTATACAAVEACEAIAGVTPALKWPNDLIVMADDGAVRGKVAGILAESIVEAGQLRAVVVGMGLNVNWPADLPADLVGIAIALNHVVGGDIDREDLLIAFLERLDRWADQLADVDRRGRLVARYRELCRTIGASVRIELPTDSFAGTATDITDAGHLVVTLDDGSTRHVVAGDVVHVRPA
jgi:BirA family biotin operon repressor/biotin-[acetyl-CoA-carboxylase] ligase